MTMKVEMNLKQYVDDKGVIDEAIGGTLTMEGISKFKPYSFGSLLYTVN